MRKILKHIVILLLTWEARLVLFRHRPRIVGITGSVGKTSTKDATALVLGAHYDVRKTEKSLNSEFGVPLTILGATSGWRDPKAWLLILLRGLKIILLPYKYPEWLVLEVGADHPGDIRKIGAWLKPDIMIGTRMSDVPVHVEFFDSPKAVVREKRYLAEAVKEDGVLVLNFDDNDIRGFKEKVSRRSLTYGIDERADIRGTYPHILCGEEGVPTGMAFKIEDGKHTVPVNIEGTIGEHVMYTVLAGVTAGVASGLNLVEATEMFDQYVSPPGRMRILAGIKGSTILDDSYNSSPVALENALHALHTIDTEVSPRRQQRKIAVIGDMRELGDFNDEAHEHAGKKASLIVDALFIVGDNRELIRAAAIEGGMSEKDIFVFEDSKVAGKELEHFLQEGDLVLIKGSQYVRLERVVEEVMAEPKRAQELLVRQETEWKER